MGHNESDFVDDVFGSETVMHLLDLPSRCGNPRGRAASRIDPYEVDLWASGSQGSWMTRKVADALVRSGRARLRVAERSYGLETPMAEILTPRLRTRRLASLAALAQWRTLTAQQIAAFSGQESDLERWDDMAVLWSAGLVDRGRIPTDLKTERLPPLYRPLPGRRLDAVLESLDYHDWLAVTAGRRITRGPRHDRHNLLAAEVALRVAEFTDIAAVYGERLAEQEIVIRRPPRGWANSKARRASGDGVLIRDDGLRVVIELTATVGPTFGEKVRRWCDAFSESDFDDEGLVVLFIEAGGQGQSNMTHRRLRMLLAKAIREYPGARRRRMDERFAIARWSDWFPDTYLVHRSLMTLGVQRPTGFGEDRWEAADLLGPNHIAFTPHDPGWFTAAVDNQALLLGVPTWMGPTDTDDANNALWRFMHDRARDVDYRAGT